MKADHERSARLHAFAHDLRNRLIGMNQALQRLAEDASPEEKNEYLTYGEQQYFKALREVESMLDDMGVDRGRCEPVRAQVDIGGLILSRVDLLAFRFERKKQSVVLDLDQAPVLALDERMIGDLLDALLSNASKFSGRDKRIHVAARPEQGWLIISVHDEGVGLTGADLEQVFVRFAWLGSTPTGGESQGRGTLARARGWARAHGGDLYASSEGPGNGCTFTVKLPLDGRPTT